MILKVHIASREEITRGAKGHSQMWQPGFRQFIGVQRSLAKLSLEAKSEILLTSKSFGA